MIRLMAALLLSALMLSPVQAQSAQRLTELMRFCVLGVAANDPTQAKAPDGVEASRDGVRWSDGTYGMTIAPAEESWKCDIVGNDPVLMLQVSEAFFDQTQTDVDLRKTWDNDQGEMILGKSCVEGQSVILIVNGRQGERLGKGLFTATDFRAGGPCSKG